MRILVVLVSHATRNDVYLARVIEEYQSMPFEADIIVVSDIAKPLPDGVSLQLVDMRGKDPWSLPFAHKEVMAGKCNDYDLFIYSEDDILVTEANIRAFLKYSAALPANEIPGFLRFEVDASGKKNFLDFHAHFHWDPSSVRVRSGSTFAYFTNEHAACYLLTREQLLKAITSGGFLVGPHVGRYPLPETAATDPYTQCGFKKFICISDFRSFLVHHLPNSYVGRAGISEEMLISHIETLLKLGQTGACPEALFATESRLATGIFSKNYYEPARLEIISAIPAEARSVLSIGCGVGEIEGRLADAGLRVTAVPLDPVIPGRAKGKEIEIVSGPLVSVLQTLTGRQFDCILLTNVLHLVPDPANLLCYLGGLLSRSGVGVLVSPNFLQANVIWRRFRHDVRFKDIGDYTKTGVHWISPGKLASWIRDAGLQLQEVVPLLRSNHAVGPFRRAIDRLLPPELLMKVGLPQSNVATLPVLDLSRRGRNNDCYGSTGGSTDQRGDGNVSRAAC